LGGKVLAIKSTELRMALLINSAGHEIASYEKVIACDNLKSEAKEVLIQYPQSGKDQEKKL
jgi:hypothetical protein